MSHEFEEFSGQDFGLPDEFDNDLPFVLKTAWLQALKELHAQRHPQESTNLRAVRVRNSMVAMNTILAEMYRISGDRRLQKRKVGELEGEFLTPLVVKILLSLAECEEEKIASISQRKYHQAVRENLDVLPEVTRRAIALQEEEQQRALQEKEKERQEWEAKRAQILDEIKITDLSPEQLQIAHEGSLRLVQKIFSEKQKKFQSLRKFSSREREEFIQIVYPQLLFIFLQSEIKFRGEEMRAILLYFQLDGGPPRKYEDLGLIFGVASSTISSYLNFGCIRIRQSPWSDPLWKSIEAKL